MPALISAEQAAKEVVAGWESGQFEIHFPKRFTFWMKALRAMHHSLYFGLVRRGTAT